MSSSAAACRPGLPCSVSAAAWVLRPSSSACEDFSMTYENFELEIDADGIALVTFDMPGRSMNVLSDSSMAEFTKIAEQIKSDSAIKGAIITSGKPAFCAGADLSMLESNAAAVQS